MRLFKSSNKSQASVDRLPSSRSSSPDPSHSHSRSSYIASSGAQTGPAFADRPAYPSQPQPLQAADDHRKILPYPQDSVAGVPHPAHVLARDSAEGAGYVDNARRPSAPITVIPPTSPQPPPQSFGPAPIPGQTHFGHSKQVHVPTEKEHRSKRSIFGLKSSKDKDKDKDKDSQHSPVDKKGGLGRSGSIHLLRRSHHQSQPAELGSPSSPVGNPNIRQSAYFARSDQSLENSPEDPSHYEQYRGQQYQQQGQPPQQSQENYDPSPTSQYSQRSPEDARYHQQQQQQPPPGQNHYPPPPDKYLPYQQAESANNSEHYLPYVQGPAQGRPAGAIIAEQLQAFRPPSQTSLHNSLGPPSPVLGQQDSRPSTAQTSRYSAQSVGQPTLQHPQQMARGDPPNGNTRQQQMPQRDPRDEHLYQQDPRMRMSQHQADHGRNTPPPRSSNREDLRDLDYNQLLQKHEELQAKYSKVKRYYFEREAQVTQLQNTVATQRLSMSKTSLDDAQYAQRFERLSGAINNLAFNIRKDWKKVPPWLQPVCNTDAHNIGTKEMTAVGRTCITRWLNDTLFRQTFHPGIPTDVSAYLKAVEQNLRSQASSGLVFTDEQRDDQLNKLTSWRLTTIEGLAPYLNSKEAITYQDNLTTSLTNALTGSLQANLKDPPPPGLQEGSRDVVITYFMPGEQINDNLMKIESGMTALTSPGQDPSQQRASIAPSSTESPSNMPGAGDSQDDLDSVEEQIREAAAKATQSGRTDSVPSVAGGAKVNNNTNDKGRDKQQKGSSFLGGFVSKKPTPQQQTSVPPGNRSAGAGVSRERLQAESQQQQQQQEDAQQGGGGPGPVSIFQPGEGRIRFAAFLAVEVRGKVGGSQAPSTKEGSAGPGEQGSAAGAGGGEGGRVSVNVLCKAPVYEL
ncbi:uncharacterized protein AB675_5772 [Cyphellophora attinorum]|uniref:Uncharacterized protein n=1 Tax=Cyphellophora attinorum TaxID=1664694 RepID=A0A0N1H2H8_9EURO|nr:uncharacterized protein AB675_5772 [Phialophora attinorum]KPI38864.1 hypothetical protein AB675_5772 [Phialophora attinorum]